MRHFDLTPPEPDVNERLDIIEDKLELMALHLEALYETIKAKGTEHEAAIN